MNPLSHPTSSEHATTATALSIKRLFTSPGTHPFEAVEWELRNARIGHGDRVAFEQENVEFPKSWSQNATNIVAQKYFRGQLGSPERETLGQGDDQPRRRHDHAAGVARAATSPPKTTRRPSTTSSPTSCCTRSRRSTRPCGSTSAGTSRRARRSGERVLHPLGRGHDGVDPRLEHQGGHDLPRRLRLGHQPLEHPRLDGAARQGGTASGPVSFMRGADSWAGRSSPAASTRRAAKMVVLNIDHPDIREFI